MATSMKTTANLANIAALSAALMPSAPAKNNLTINPAPAEKGVVGRATWTGVLGFGLVNMGVKTFKATEIEKVSFNRVHVCNADKVAEGETPVYNNLNQGKMHCAICDVDVESADMLSGYKYAEGMYAIVSDEEKKACMVESDKQMAITSFVKPHEIDTIFFESAEYLVPEKGFEGTFAMLREAMIARGVVALAHSSQRGREYTSVIRPYGTNGMAIHYLYFDNEVRTCDKWQTVAVSDTAREAAGMLIDALTDHFDPTEAEDSYMRNLKGIINAKIEGTAPVALPAPVAPVADKKVDVMAMLAASLTAPKPVKKAKMKAAAVAA